MYSRLLSSRQLAFFLLLVIIFLAADSLVPLRLLSLSLPIFFGCASFLLGCSYCLSLLSGSPLLRFSFTMSSLVCGSLYDALLRFPGPLFWSPPAFSLTSGSGAVATFLLLHLFLPGLSAGTLYIGALAPSGLPVLLLLPFFLCMSFCIASTFLFYGYPGILAWVFSAIILSRLPLSRQSPLPFQLFASRLIISPFVSFSTFSGVLLHSPDSMQLALAPPLFPFLGSYGDVLFCFYFLFSFLCVILMAACYFFTSPISVPLLILLIICGFGFLPLLLQTLLFICLFPFMLGHIIFFLFGLSNLSWTSLLLLLIRGLFRVFFLGGLFRELFLCATISSPLAFFSFGRVCYPLGSSSSLLPSCLAPASHGFLQWYPTYAVRGLLPLVMRLCFGCLLAHDGVPVRSSLLVILFSIVFLTSSSPSTL